MSTKESKMTNKQIVIFEQNHTIRREWVTDSSGNGEWYFVVVDVIAALLESNQPNQYWHNLKKRVLKNSEVDLSQVCINLSVRHLKSNRKFSMECATVRGIFRIIQSIPSPKAEPFKQWLAQIGEEKLEAEADPTLYLDMARRAYRKLGYSDKWIDSRIQKLTSSEALTQEWLKRGVPPEQHEELIDIIQKETFGLTIDQHKQFKGVEPESSLQDNMTRLELVFDALGDEASIAISQQEDAEGFDENKVSAKRGGQFANKTLENFEAETGKKVLSKENQQQLTGNSKDKLGPKHGED
jgi:hypothetical protein